MIVAHRRLDALPALLHGGVLPMAAIARQEGFKRIFARWSVALFAARRCVG